MEEALEGSSETPQSNGSSENNSEMQQHEVKYYNLDAGLPIPKKFHCPHCPKVFANKSNVNRHCRISHNNSKVTEVKYDNLDVVLPISEVPEVGQNVVLMEEALEGSSETPQSNGSSENNSEMQQHEVKYDNLDAVLPIFQVPEVGQIETYKRRRKMTQSPNDYKANTSLSRLPSPSWSNNTNESINSNAEKQIIATIPPMTFDQETQTDFKVSSMDGSQSKEINKITEQLEMLLIENL